MQVSCIVAWFFLALILPILAFLPAFSLFFLMLYFFFVTLNASIPLLFIFSCPLLSSSPFCPLLSSLLSLLLFLILFSTHLPFFLFSFSLHSPLTLRFPLLPFSSISLFRIPFNSSFSSPLPLPYSSPFPSPPHPPSPSPFLSFTLQYFLPLPFLSSPPPSFFPSSPYPSFLLPHSLFFPPSYSLFFPPTYSLFFLPSYYLSFSFFSPPPGILPLPSSPPLLSLSLN